MASNQLEKQSSTNDLNAEGTQTRNDKKREILKYLEEKAEQQDLLSLQRKEIIGEFSTSYHTSETIDEILDEILEEEPINEISHSLDILYHERNEDKIEEIVSTKNKGSLFNTFFIGFYALIGIVTYMDSNSFFLQASDGQVTWIAAVGIIVSYGIGRIVSKLTTYVEARVPPLQEHKTIIYPTIGVLLVCGLVMVAYSYLFSKEIPAVAVATFLTGSIAAGIQIGKYIESKGHGATTLDDIE